MKLFLGITSILVAAVVLSTAYIQGGGPEVSRREAVKVKPKQHASPTEPTAEPTLEKALSNSMPEARRAMLREWAERIELDQIAGLLEHINAELNPEEMRAEARQALLVSWSRRDLPALGNWFGTRYAADELHQEARAELLRVLTREKPADAFSWMEKVLPTPAREELCEPFFRHWAALDAVAASTKLLQLTESEANNPRWILLLGTIVDQWSQTGLLPAVAWTKSLPPGPAKTKALEQLSYRWAKIDPRAAAAYAAAQSDSTVFEAVASSWAAIDPKNSAAWALTLPLGEGRNRAVAIASSVWAGQAPVSAAEYVESMPPGEEQNEARIAVASRWAETQPREAATWAEEFPENSAREQVFSQITTAWTIADPQNAAQWLQGLEKSRSRDAAVLAYCSVVEANNPSAVFALAESISDESIRQQRLEQIATAWLASNPEAARISITKSRLPDTLKVQLLMRNDG